MVSSKEMRASNALINDATAPRISVFIGGTSGIGQLTVKALVATGASLRIYLVGRKSAKERTLAFIQELSMINPKAELIFIEGEVSLLAETTKACEVIKSRESRIDLLFLTPGYAPFGAREETTEGLAIVQSLAYYSRMLCIQHLMPLLSRAEAPRVVSVLGGGLEKANIDINDLDMKKPGNFGPGKAQIQSATMNTASLEILANENPNVTFIHSWPGWVNTGNVRRGLDPNSILGWVIWLFLEPLIALFSFSDDESAQRHLFQSTSAVYGGRGISWNGKPGVNTLGGQANGAFLVNYKCNCTPNAKVMRSLRDRAQKPIWDHTQDVLRPYL